MNQLWQRYADKRYVGILRALRQRILLSRAALWLEVLSRRFWPIWTLALFTYAFLAFGGLGWFSVNGGRVFMVLVLLVGAVFLVLGLRGFRLPRRDHAIDRLDSGSVDAPLASLRDHPATGQDDTFTKELWELHQSRMAAEAAGLKPAAPDLRLSRYDRNGLRFMALVSAMAAVMFAPSGALTNAKQVLLTPIAAGGIGTSIEAWARPPAYTGKPQVYLGDVTDEAVLQLPTGTQVVMQVYGGTEKISLVQDVSDTAVAFSGEHASVQNVTIPLVKSGEISVHEGKQVLDSWRFITTADAPPNIVVTQEVGQTTSGAMELPFTATDDYGVVAGSVSIALDLVRVDRRFGLAADPVARQALTTNLPMPFRGATDKVNEVLVEDFSKDIWVGMPVNISLEVRDAAGQPGRFETSGILPGKRFFVPLAAAIAEQRRDLLWSPDNDRRVLQVLLALANLPEDLALSTGTYLKIRTTIRRLEQSSADGLTEEERSEVAEALWQVAIFLEDGDLGDARERLRRAQEKLLQALEQNAEQEEISELMDELREATDEYMEMLAAEQEQTEPSENAQQPSDGNDQLREMLDELQRLAENGETEEARKLLEAMRQMMEDMQLAEQQGGNSEQMQEMQDALSQQQGLSDQTFQQLQDMMEGGEEQDGQELAEQQEALRELLEQLQDQQGGGARESTGAADENMGEARDHLQEGDLGKALNEQAEAMENLREAIRQLGEEMQQAGQGRDGLQEGETQDTQSTRDPLGRPLGRTGTTESGDTVVPDQNASERARELLDEIRRRSGDLSRPDAEIEYLKRLLDRF